MVLSKSLWALCLSLGAFVEAHPGPHLSPNNAVLQARSQMAKRCANNIGAMKQKRHQLRKRDAALRERNETTYTVHAEAPRYDFIKNDTCILYPEETEGPYWYPASQLLTQNLAQNQVGVPLELDIGVIDVNTCEPLSNVLIDLWHCNATGSYSSFTKRDPNTPFSEILTAENLTGTEGDYRFLHTDNTTWLRGMWPTDANGATSFASIFPGFYIERSIHIHVQVHTNWTVRANGTISHSDVVETGQIFFDEALESEIMALEPYVSHTEIERTKNAVDGIFAQQAQSGAMVTVDAEPLDGCDFKNGVLGYITLGIDTTTIKNGTTASPTGVPIN